VTISDILHQQRAIRLQKAPKTSGTVLSAGCSGTFYFDWFEKNYGKVTRHIGIELFADKPNDLPPYVEWISNTVGNMSDVADAACDVIFSGQNIEHLWPDDVIASLLESNRVLKEGGHLIIDSPNRHVTRKLGWVHPEHMIEFTPEEATTMLKLAGFDVIDVYGIWTCIDPKTNTLMDFEGVSSESPLTKSTRSALATKHPKESFIWWIEAKKTNRGPKKKELRDKVYTIFNKAWVERKSRTSTQGLIKSKKQFRSNGELKQFLIYGPYIPLPAGDYVATYQFDIPKTASTERIIMSCDIVSLKDANISRQYVTLDYLRANDGKVDLYFSLDELHFGVEARCLMRGNCPMIINRTVEFKEIGNLDSQIIL